MFFFESGGFAPTPPWGGTCFRAMSPTLRDSGSAPRTSLQPSSYASGGVHAARPTHSPPPAVPRPPGVEGAKPARHQAKLEQTMSPLPACGEGVRGWGDPSQQHA